MEWVSALELLRLPFLQFYLIYVEWTKEWSKPGLDYCSVQVVLYTLFALYSNFASNPIVLL